MMMRRRMLGLRGVRKEFKIIISEMRAKGQWSCERIIYKCVSINKQKTTKQNMSMQNSRGPVSMTYIGILTALKTQGYNCSSSSACRAESKIHDGQSQWSP